MKIPILFAALLTAITGAHAQNVVVLVEEDFETGGGALNGGNPGAVLSQVADPDAAGANGTVAAIDIGAGGEWGEVRTVPADVSLPPAAIPGTDTFLATMDVYIDSATTTLVTGEANDRINLILRFTDGVDVAATRVGQASNNQWETLLVDQWQTIQVMGTIPAVDLAGSAITTIVPIVSVRDDGNNGVAGTAFYFDNFRLEVTVPDDDPNLGVGPSLSFGQVIQGAGPELRNLQVDNTGAVNDLTISGVTVTGTNAAAFTVSDPTVFPVVIAAGAGAAFEVTFDPGVTLGGFSASLEFASDDENDAVVTTALSATVIPPFNGSELIINGDFESGDLSAWGETARFNFAAMPTHDGNGAAVFNLAGGAQWGEARISAPSPPTTADDPQAIEITPDMIGKNYEYSAWYFCPAAGGMAADDTVQTIFRWNKNNTMSHSHGFLTVGDMPVDTWVEVTGTGVVPATGGDGLATTSVVPLWSFRDVNSDALGGELMYIDDVSFRIEAPPATPDPEITDFAIDQGADTISVTWSAVLGATYAIDRSTGLQPDVIAGVGWLELDDGFIATSTEETFNDIGAVTLGADKLFYRIRLVELP